MCRLVLALLLVAGCRPKASPERIVTLLATAEIHGTPEPCGCQSDPLGDVARIGGLFQQAQRRGPALLVDAGGLRRTNQPIPEAAEAQAQLKAHFLERTFRDLGAVLGDDLVQPEVRTIDGLKIGLLRLGAAPAPVVAGLRSQGADLIVALAQVDRATARQIARSTPGISILVVGKEVGEGGAPEQLGETLIVQPAEEGQRIVRIVLHMANGTLSTRLVASETDRARERARTQQKIAVLDNEIAQLEKDPTAEPAFVATKRRQRAELAAALAAPTPTPSGSYAIAELMPIRHTLPRDPQIAAAMKVLDAAVGEANRTAGEKMAVPAAAPGAAHYVGLEQCELCHDEAVNFWKTTVHARAWNELVQVNKQWSFDCIGCHITGYGQRGGSAMAHVDGLTDVQCEVCHGPGSQHVERPQKMRLKMPSDNDCKSCHTKDHSDTFQYAPYLRDVLGPGHGEKRRTALGEGPTGHELRHAAQQKAGGHSL